MASSNTPSTSSGAVVIHYAPFAKQPNIEDHFKSVIEGKKDPVVLHQSFGM